MLSRLAVFGIKCYMCLNPTNECAKPGGGPGNEVTCTFVRFGKLLSKNCVK